jgi:hypothetical protein
MYFEKYTVRSTSKYMYKIEVPDWSCISDMYVGLHVCTALLDIDIECHRYYHYKQCRLSTPHEEGWSGLRGVLQNQK